MDGCLYFPSTYFSERITENMKVKQQLEFNNQWTVMDFEFCLNCWFKCVSYLFSSIMQLFFFCMNYIVFSHNCPQQTYLVKM